MQRATRTNLILLGVVAMLGIAAYLQVDREVSRFEPPLGALDPAGIDRVTVSCLQCVPRRFEREDGHWFMREPYALPADDAQLARLLSIAASPVRSRRDAARFDARKIGLDPALIRLDLGAMHFDIGTTDAFNGDRYVRVGNTIAMVPDRFSPFLVAAPASELDRHLLPRGSILASLQIDGIERRDLIEAWNLAMASRITAADGTAPASVLANVQLHLGDGTRIDYRLVRDTDAIVARRAEPALSYTLSAEQGSLLLGTAGSDTH
ncbi:MAG TPA: hypothetical protein PK001_07150 [Dokdonella sp.]|uniref:hypothetical protein n=1 Tax=Dokdonella sp. TaxID=2291710 RepID=UPI002BDB6DB1|nr:hypothetical protein [Dokdonella sp.]HOX71502.1 hypothetical protein [Dokdonella sp.]